MRRSSHRAFGLKDLEDLSERTVVSRPGPLQGAAGGRPTAGQRLRTGRPETDSVAPRPRSGLTRRTDARAPCQGGKAPLNRLHQHVPVGWMEAVISLFLVDFNRFVRTSATRRVTS